jgi:hypothetical protein
MDPYLIAEMQAFGGDDARNVTWGGAVSLGGRDDHYFEESHITPLEPRPVPD